MSNSSLVPLPKLFVIFRYILTSPLYMVKMCRALARPLRSSWIATRCERDRQKGHIANDQRHRYGRRARGCGPDDRVDSGECPTSEHRPGRVLRLWFAPVLPTAACAAAALRAAASLPAPPGVSAAACTSAGLPAAGVLSSAAARRRSVLCSRSATRTAAVLWHAGRDQPGDSARNPGWRLRRRRSSKCPGVRGPRRHRHRTRVSWLQLAVHGSGARGSKPRASLPTLPLDNPKRLDIMPRIGKLRELSAY